MRRIAIGTIAFVTIVLIVSLYLLNQPIESFGEGDSIGHTLRSLKP